MKDLIIGEDAYLSKKFTLVGIFGGKGLPPVDNYLY